MSGEAKQFLLQPEVDYDTFVSHLLARAEAVYPTIIEETVIAGVKAKVLSPENGIPKRNRDRILINLHGGGFKCGDTEQLLESIPIASVEAIKVVSVTYRCFPQYRFPAATKDVISVYRALLEKYSPWNIGIYGCSAGGVLTAESIAWIKKSQLPPPGAIGIFCEADAIAAGDSRYVWGDPPTPGSSPPRMAYFDGTDASDPSASPTLYDETLRSFPPTLLITGSRDFAASPIFYAHTQLVKVGVDAELHVWEGMWHAFFTNVDIPESKEMYNVTARFFDSHLGKH